MNGTKELLLLNTNSKVIANNLFSNRVNNKNHNKIICESDHHKTSLVTKHMTMKRVYLLVVKVHMEESKKNGDYKKEMQS